MKESFIENFGVKFQERIYIMRQMVLLKSLFGK